MREQSKQLTASGSGAQLRKPPLKRVFAAQFLVLLMISAGLYLLLDNTTALSAWFGGLTALLPNIYFAHRAFRFSGARAATLVVRSFYQGEAGKVLLTAILFAGVFILLRPISIEVLFLVYVLMMALNWVLALIFFKYSSKR